MINIQKSILKKNCYFLFFFILIIVLYSMVGYFSYPLDDEIFNIKVIEKYGINSIFFVQTSDVHPPGSYFANWILFLLFNGDWQMIHTVTGLLTSFIIIYSILAVYRRYGKINSIIYFFLFGLNPSILLWCTSIRWYAYFIPVLIWLSFPPEKNNWYYWVKCFLGILLLGYIGYAFFLLVIPIIFLYWKKSPMDNKQNIKWFILLGSISFILYLPQFYVFFSVHIHNADRQFGSMWRCIIGFCISEMSNQGLFPVSLGGVSSILGTLGLFFTIIINIYKQKIKANIYFILFLISSIVLIFSGLGGKFRNFIILEPWKNMGLSIFNSNFYMRKKMVFLFLLCIFLGNAMGIICVVSHNDTTKNGWNLPVNKVLKHVESLENKDDILILTHNSTLSYVYEQNGFNVLSRYSFHKINNEKLDKHYKFVIFLDTFIGDLSSQEYSNLISDIDKIVYKSKSSIYFGADKFYFFKKILDSSFPMHQIGLIQYTDVKNVRELEYWYEDTFYNE